MKTGEIIKTVEIKTPHGVFTVPRVTFAGVYYGKKNYYSHVYNSMGQKISGGFMFVEGSAMAKRFGI